MRAHFDVFPRGTYRIMALKQFRNPGVTALSVPGLLVCALLACALLPCALLTGCRATPPSNWSALVPPATQSLADPLPTTQANISLGSQTYQLYCNSCHGEHGEGHSGRPALNTARVQHETDGDIYWILHNGSKGHGMPAWRSLGDPDLWQLVQYIRTLPPQT
jgi:cytochrome c553